MTANQPSVEERLSRLETLFTNVGETVLAQNNAIAAQSATIDVLVANIQQLTDNVAALGTRVDELTANVAATNQRVVRSTNPTYPKPVATMTQPLLQLGF
jgi:uncharacterized coiled-coil protein SlyX